MKSGAVRFKSGDAQMGRIVRRSVECYGSQADDAALEKLLEKIEESTGRAKRGPSRE